MQIELNRTFFIDDWIILSLILGFFLIGFLKKINSTRFSYLIRFYETILYINIYYKGQKSLKTKFFYLASLFTLKSYSLSIYFLINSIFNNLKGFYFFLLIFISLLLLAFLRLFLMNIFSIIFNYKERFYKLIFTSSTYYLQSSFLLFFSNLLLLFVFKSGIYYMYIMFGLSFLYFITKQFNMFLKNIKNFKSFFFYIILYLCAFKISPLILIFKGLSF